MAIQTSSRSYILWRTCLASAFRTALASSIVGVATLYGPEPLKRQIAFPAFSYVTVILIVTDATLGDAFRGCWHALYATCQSLLPAILSLWLIGPARLTASTTAAAVALSAFLVVLPENTHFVAKRIALGQIVVVYTSAYINGGKTGPVVLPFRIAASTAIGVAACVLALLFPYPGLACSQVKQNWELFAENASERLKVLVKAFSAEDNRSALALVSQSKSLAARATKLLRNIKSKQESMQWELYPIKFLRPYCKNPGDRLQEYETPLRGMGIALSSNDNDNPPQFPVTELSSEVKDGLNTAAHHISKQIKNSSPFHIATVSESNAETALKFLHSLQPVQELPTLFFFFCFKLLLIKDNNSVKKQEERFFQKICKKRLMAAFKCSLSLGLAVFSGLFYSKPDGFWAGLPIAISYVSAREATFRVTNVKAQGTVLGSIYGVLGCFVFAKYDRFRFVSLIPWFIVCSFLRRSRMYGQAGGVSACIGAVLILGRQGYGPPSEFAMVRIIETFIGLSCFILVEILFQPKRASSLAKTQLSKSLQLLSECITSISLIDSSKKCKLEESQKKLKVGVTQLGKFIEEADVEPNFWFLPFHSDCYGKLLGSLSRMVEYVHFVAQALRFLDHGNNLWKETIKNKLESDLSLFREYVIPSIKCCEEVISLVGSISALDKEFEKKKSSINHELGKLPTPHNMIGSGGDEEIEMKVKLFLENSRGVVDEIVAGEDEDREVKSQVVLSLGALAFCMRSIGKEVRDIDKAIKEVVQWENPLNEVNLHDISCKIRALEQTVTK